MKGHGAPAKDQERSILKTLGMFLLYMPASLQFILCNKESTSPINCRLNECGLSLDSFCKMTEFFLLHIG